MLKVFLVEDEKIMREGIKENIDWTKEGFLFSGEAQDGEIAYPMIREIQPDIVITDIKMPFMDGLELSKLIKKNMPWIKIIILSGFDEFEFAKEAINIGVTEYLLKPIDRQELLKAIKRVSDMIYEEKAKEDYYNKIHEETAINQALFKKEFFNKMLSGQLGVAEILEEGKKLNIDLSGQFYQILLLHTDGYWIIEQSLHQQNEWVICLDRDLEGYGFIIKALDVHQLKKYREEFIENSVQSLEAQNVRYFIGIGDEVNRLSQLPKAFESAKRVFAYRYLLNENKVMESSYHEENNAYSETIIDIDQLKPEELNNQSIEKFLKIGSADEVDAYLKRYFECIGSKNLSSLMFRQYIAMNIYILVVTFLDELGYDRKKIESVCEEISGAQIKMKQLDTMKEYVKGLIRNAVELRDAITTQKYTQIIEKAKLYIQEKYNDELISLNSVANHVNMSPSHFSVIFSKETEKTFTEYLTEVRMDKAKELLRCTSMKTSDICFEVGYKNPQYFSYIFKKINHYTPRDYKQLGRED
jgi:two-component system response regulator YesN